MQFIVISEQLRAILYAFFAGVFLGFLYDIFRFLRRLLPFRRAEIIIANLMDIAYSLIGGSLFVILVFSVSVGRYRWFIANAVILGFAVYRLAPGRLLKPIMFWLADLLLRMVRFFIKKPALKIIRSVGCTFDKIKARLLLKQRRKFTDKCEKDLCSLAWIKL